MLSRTYCLFIECILLLFITGCNKKESRVEIIQKIKKEKLEDKFYGYSTFFWPKGAVRFVVSKDNYVIFRFDRIFGFIINTSYKRITKQQELTGQKLVEEMNKLNLVGFISEKQYCIYYSTYQDSTYSQVFHQRPNYINKLNREYTLPENAERRPYRLAFVQTQDTSKLPRTISRMYHLDKIQEGWYCFRTFTFRDLEQF